MAWNPKWAAMTTKTDIARSPSRTGSVRLERTSSRACRHRGRSGRLAEPRACIHMSADRYLLAERSAGAGPSATGPMGAVLTTMRSQRCDWLSTGGPLGGQVLGTPSQRW